jgi:hypothetical protein
MLRRKYVTAVAMFALSVSFWALIAHVVDALGGQPPKYVSLLGADTLCVFLSALLFLEVMYDRS